MYTKSLLAATIALALSAPAAHADDWLQFGYDSIHSGTNFNEKTLGANNINQAILRYRTQVSGINGSGIDGQLLYLNGVNTAAGKKNLLFAVASNGTVLALDAANGNVVWSAGQYAVASATVYSVSTPALDPNRQYLYAMALQGYVHKYRVADGSEVTGGGWPQLVSGKVDVERVSAGLTVGTSGGKNTLYVVTASYNDTGNYQGHLVSIDLASGTQNVFNTLCSNLSVHLNASGTAGVDYCPGFGNGMWSRGGVAFDPGTNRVYLATGNGPYDANAGGTYWGDSVLALTPNGTGVNGKPLDSYTPATYDALADNDADLGSTSPVILAIPGGYYYSHLAMQIGKDACLRILNLDNLSGRGGPGNVGGALQEVGLPTGVDNCASGGDVVANEVKQQIANWVNPATGAPWIFVGNKLGLNAYELTVYGFVPRWTKSALTTSPVIANGVLYYAGTTPSDASGAKHLVALDPVSGNELRVSPAIANSLHFQAPTVVDGNVYFVDGDHYLWNFGLPN